MSEFKFMSVQINYNKIASKSSPHNVVFFVDERFNILNLKKYITNSEYYYTQDLLKTKDLKKKLIIAEISSKKKIILVSIKKNIKHFEAENLGAKFYSFKKYQNG